MLIPSWQKLIAIIIYMLPWSDAIPFSRYIISEFPILTWLIIPTWPIYIIKQIIPYGGILLFFGLFLGVIRNPKVPYFLRFNSLQAILIDITLVLISYAFQIILNPLGESLLIRTLSSSIWIMMLAITIFSIFECIRGKEPDLPTISEAVRMQI